MATLPGHPEPTRRHRALAHRGRRALAMALELALGRAVAGKLDELTQQITEVSLAVMARDEDLRGLVAQLSGRVAGLEQHLRTLPPAGAPTGADSGQLAEVRSLLVEIQQHLADSR